MTYRAVGLLPLAGALTLGACQTAPAAHSGFLTSYDGLTSPRSGYRLGQDQTRDDTASDAIQRVFIEPAILAPGVGEPFDDDERLAILREVDRQICVEVSERFEVVDRIDPETGVIRTSVVQLDPTGRIGSGVSAVANFFNPVPVINLRTPGTTGGLAVESELLAPGGGQIAAISWRRNATVVGTDSPSLSRIGDALQFAEPMGDAIGAAFASEGRATREIGDPDPCAAYGPRRNLARSATGVVAGLVTGLYIPEIERPVAPSQR